MPELEGREGEIKRRGQGARQREMEYYKNINVSGAERKELINRDRGLGREGWIKKKRRQPAEREGGIKKQGKEAGQK